MRRAFSSVFVFTTILLVPGIRTAQAQAGVPEANRSVTGGGISVAGWAGKIDPAPGQTINDAKLSKVGDVLSVTTGPAVTY